MKKKYRLFSGIVLLLFCGIIAGVVWFISSSKAAQTPPSAEAYSAFPKQTDVQNATHLFDENGVAILDIKEVGKVYNPAFVALYALTYAGVEDYFASGIQPDMQKLRNSCDWLVAALKKTPGNRYVWYYDFDSTYNDVSIQAPWFSAFGQAVGIEALCAGYEKLKEEKYLLAAQQAADVLTTPLKDGGVLYARNGLHFKDTEPGEIMSSDDLPDLDNEVIPIYLNQKRYAASGKQTGRGTPVVFLHVNPAEPTGSVNPMFYPMNLDLNNRLRLMPAAPSCGGANYLETEMANKLKELSGLTAGKEYGVCLVPYSIGRDPGTGEIVFRGPVPGPGIRKENSLNFRLKETNLLPIRLHFAAAALEVTPGFPPPYRRPKFYYLSIRQFGLMEKTPAYCG